MLKENFDALCKYLGDQSLPENERWKSLKYISFTGHVLPTIDFQNAFKKHMAYYVDNNETGPGIFVLDFADSDLGVTNINDKVITFIPLERIEVVTFTVNKKAEDGSKEISIYEVISDISDTTGIDIPVSIRFPDNVYYFKADETNWTIPVAFSRKITDDNYTISYEDSLGNKLDEKPTKVGTYFACITCTNGYTGEGKVQFKIQ